jgi:hypothetical protein
VSVVNPWLPQSRPPRGTNEKPTRLVQIPPDPTGPAAPQGPGVPPPERALPGCPPHAGHRPSGGGLGVHGGAGVSTLKRAVPGGRDASRAWPAAPESQPVVLVARSSANGLRAAQNAAQQWASGMVSGVELLGLVVVADAPGKLPKSLRDRVRLVSGGVPRLWEIPWTEPWRLGEPPSAHLPKECGPLARDLARLTRLV